MIKHFWEVYVGLKVSKSLLPYYVASVLFVPEQVGSYWAACGNPVLKWGKHIKIHRLNLTFKSDQIESIGRNILIKCSYPR